MWNCDRKIFPVVLIEIITATSLNWWVPATYPAFVAQVKGELAARSEKCLVMVCYATKGYHSAILCGVLSASLPYRAGVASQQGRNLQFVFCWSNQSPATCVFNCVLSTWSAVSVVNMACYEQACYERGLTSREPRRIGVKPGVSNCSEGQMSTYKVTRRPHYDADATVTTPEPF